MTPEVLADQINANLSGNCLGLSEPPQPPTKRDLLAEFVSLAAKRDQLEADLEQCKADLKAAEERLLDDWADRCQTQAKVDGKTIYVAHDFYCSKRGGVDTRVVCDRLKDLGYGLIVTEGYNAQSLKALVKEKVDAGEEVPATLAELLNFDSIPRLRVRRS